EVAASLPGANLPWLARLRDEAIGRFADEGWPTTRRENWRHTSLAFMEQQALAVSEAVAPEAIVADLRARYGAAQSPGKAHAFDQAALRGQARSHRRGLDAGMGDEGLLRGQARSHGANPATEAASTTAAVGAGLPANDV